MNRVLFIGQAPETVDYSDAALPPGTTVEKIAKGIQSAVEDMASRGWQVDLCMITPDNAGIDQLKAQLGTMLYDCVVIGGGLRVPEKTLRLFEAVINAVHRLQPEAAIAFNTRPQDTAEAAARWIV